MTKEIKTHLSANSNMTRKNIMINNFLGGLSWGLGSALGASVILAIAVKILTLFHIPGLSDFLQNLK